MHTNIYLYETLFIYPNELIRKGDSWTKTYSTSGNMPAQYQVRFTVTEINGDMINIVSEAAITGTGEMTMQGKMSGNQLIDNRSGLVTKAEFTEEVEAKAEDLLITRKSHGTTMGTAQ